MKLCFLSFFFLRNPWVQKWSQLTWIRWRCPQSKMWWNRQQWWSGQQHSSPSSSPSWAWTPTWMMLPLTGFAVSPARSSISEICRGNATTLNVQGWKCRHWGRTPCLFFDNLLTSCLITNSILSCMDIWQSCSKYVGWMLGDCHWYNLQEVGDVV